MQSLPHTHRLHHITRSLTQHIVPSRTLSHSKHTFKVMTSFAVPSAFDTSELNIPKIELFTNTLRTMVENKDSFDDA